MKPRRAWIIIPLLIISIADDGTREITIGWWTQLYTITWNQKNK
jgi:hypothetical protein